MDWSHLQHKIPFEKNFRWRGGEVSRIEAFTDAVFALSVTVLVVSTQVPSSYAELIATMKLFPTFALSFVLLSLAPADPFQGMAGFAYMLLPIVHPIHGRREARGEQEALARMAATEEDGGGRPSC